jgi:hypothetical protein
MSEKDPGLAALLERVERLLAAELAAGRCPRTCITWPKEGGLEIRIWVDPQCASDDSVNG